MKKRIICFLLAMMCLFMFAGCGTVDNSDAEASSEAPSQSSEVPEETLAEPEDTAPTPEESSEIGSGDGETIKLGISWPSLVNFVWKSFQDYIEEEKANVEEELGVTIDITHVSAMTDATEQNAQIKDLISSDMDVIMVGPWDTTTVWSSIEDCQAAGIPYISFVRRITPGGPEADSIVGPDTYYSAYIGTKTVLEKMIADGYDPAEIKMIHTLGDLNDQNAVKFKEGCEAAMEEFGVTPIAEIETGWDPEQCLTRLSPVVQANPDVDVIFCCNDDMVGSAQACLERVDRWAPYGDEKHCYIISQNGDMNGLKYLKDGYVDAIGIDDVRGYCKVALETAVRLARGEDVGDQFFQAPALTMDNFEELKEKSQIWALDYMSEEELAYIEN